MADGVGHDLIPAFPRAEALRDGSNHAANKVQTVMRSNRNTPWGPADHEESSVDGIVRVQTPSHGGLWLNAARWRELRAAFPTWKGYAPEQWLEEDCDWALAALVFPSDFTARDCFYAVQAVRGGSEGYFAEPLAWLESAMGASVRSKAAEYNLELPPKLVFQDTKEAA